MCGVVGICSQDPADDPEIVATMRDTLAHRGPYGVGLWISADRRVVFAHTRLAIIDLSDSGAQPMTLDNGRLCITYNGEIYNYRELRTELAQAGHRFRSTSDTEVILAAYDRWGTGAIERLEGPTRFRR